MNEEVGYFEWLVCRNGCNPNFVHFKNLKKKPIGGKGRVLFQGGIHISLFMNVMASVLHMDTLMNACSLTDMGILSLSL